MNIFLRLKNTIERYLPKRKLVFIDIGRLKPISNKFGFDRGIPVDRYYIDSFLDANKNFITGQIVEVSEKFYSEKYHSGENDIISILTYNQNLSELSIFCDLSKPETIPESYANCFICTQTLNFIYDIENSIYSCHKLLKRDGVFLGTVSGLSQISNYDMERWGDYWRFTTLSTQKLFEKYFGVGNVQVFTYGNLSASICLLQGISVNDLPNNDFLDEIDDRYQVIIGIKAFKK